MYGMRLKTLEFSVTTDASGDGSQTATRSILGLLYAVEWSDGNFDNGVDATLSILNGELGDSDTTTIATHTNADAGDWYFPRELVHDAAGGAALTGTAGGDRALPVVNGTLKLTIASGGNAKTGGCVVYYLV